MDVQRTARTSAPWVDRVRFWLRLPVHRIIVPYTWRIRASRMAIIA